MLPALLKYYFLPALARRAAGLPLRLAPPHPPPVFIVGCGRSGTTALGRLLKLHQSILYLHEPGYLWVAIDPRTDFSGAYGGAGRCMMHDADLTDTARRAALVLFGLIAKVARGRTICEKTPMNALRIGWLKAIFPDARFIWIVRRSEAVIRSIARVSQEVRISIPGRPDYHAWWGVGERKWPCLLADAKSVFGEAPLTLSPAEAQDNRVRGAVEWCLSVRLCLEWCRRTPPSQYLVIQHDELAADPTSTLDRITDWLGMKPISEPPPLLHNRRPSRPYDDDPILLPPGIAQLIRDLSRELDDHFRGSSTGCCREAPTGSNLAY